MNPTEYPILMGVLVGMAGATIGGLLVVLVLQSTRRIGQAKTRREHLEQLEMVFICALVLSVLAVTLVSMFLFGMLIAIVAAAVALAFNGCALLLCHDELRQKCNPGFSWKDVSKQVRQWFKKKRTSDDPPEDEGTTA